MGDILGVKFEAIDFVFKVYGIYEQDMQLDLFEKILIIDGVRLKISAERMATKNKNKESKK